MMDFYEEWMAYPGISFITRPSVQTKYADVEEA
jgi:hypothetical protein